VKVVGLGMDLNDNVVRRAMMLRELRRRCDAVRRSSPRYPRC